MVCASLLVALPLAWFAMNRWLEQYSFRIVINQWIFPAAAIIALGIALITVIFHALRAGVANPVNSLRSE